MALYCVKLYQDGDEVRTNGEWRYMVRGGGRYISVMDYLGSAAEVEIPAELDGLPVEEIFFKGDRVSPYSGGLSGFKGIQRLTLPDTIKTIGDMAFSGCASLESIRIPDSVRQMSEWVFADCSKLTEIRFPASMKEIPPGAMMYCSKLKRVFIPDTVTSIRSDAFQNCESLEEVILPASLRQLGNDVFMRCQSLRRLEISPENPFFTTEDGILYNKEKTELLWYPAAHPGRRYEVPGFLTGSVSFHENPFLEEICWPQGRRMETYQFDGLAGLKRINIPAGTKSLPRCSFRNCSSLTELDLPEGLEQITNAFQGCSGLTQIRFPDSLTDLDDPFTGCRSLRRVIIGPKTKVEYWFHICPELKEIRIHPDHPEYIVRDGVVYSRDGGTLLRYPPSRAGAEFVIPDSVRVIAEGAFRDSQFLQRIVCQEDTELNTTVFSGSCALTEVVLPDKIRTIPAGAFSNCSHLKQISFPEGVEVIGRNAFAGCQALESLTLPESLVEIGEGAFCECASLTEVTLPDSVRKVKKQAFSRCTGLVTAVLPPMVKSYEYGIFKDCTALQTICCMGGKSKWEKRSANQDFLTDYWLPKQVQICYPRRPARKKERNPGGDKT